MAGTKLIIAVLVGTLASQLTLAQAPQIAQALPSVEWPEWREAGADPGIRRMEVRLPSAVATPYPENGAFTVLAVLPEPLQSPVPVVVLLHYWGAADRRLEMAIAVRLARKGIASALVTLPYHLDRTPRGYRSGQLAIQPNPDKLRETMAQGALDIRRTVDWIESRPEFRRDGVGIMGTSLGSIMAGLAFGVDQRLRAGCFLLGGADLASLLWNSSRAVGPRDQLRRAGWTEAKLREALAPVEPLNYLRPGDRPALVIGARFDTVVPPRNVEALIAGLGDAQRLWIDTGHFGGALVMPELMRAAAEFFEAAFAGRAYRAPGRLYAPTLRFGVAASGERGIEVALGLDLWRSDARGSVYACALVTPRGPRLFAGAQAGRGLSVGLTILPRRTTWGAFWNVVL
jgi:pimeloyl-ACP methyl ester carboxylesterase